MSDIDNEALMSSMEQLDLQEKQYEKELRLEKNHFFKQQQARVG